VLRLYSEASDSFISGDEERAYILFYRFFDSYCIVKKSKDFQNQKYFNSIISIIKVEEVVTQLERLRIASKKIFSSERKRRIER
jgi:hypothetical protein